MAPDPDVDALLRACLADPETTWALGSFGALAFFARDPDEAAAALPGIGLATARAGLRLEPEAGLRPFAYETAFASGWSQAIALCLPEAVCAMGQRRAVTELGPDAGALHARDRDGILFDLGLGQRAVDVCLRASDPDTLAILRAGCGQPLFAPGHPVAALLEGGVRPQVFVTRIGRIEIDRPCWHPEVAAAPGPLAYLMPQRLRKGQTHAATAPIPPGLVPCGTLFPPHPARDGRGAPIPFRPERHAAFQKLLARWGDPELVALKARLRAGGTLGPDEQTRRHRQVARTVAVQAQALGEAVAGGSQRL
ncbi:DUF6925 family protein [Methylobacterium organophilum]|uniref:Uncharacterized protein n=1 Tax=Methylobacterium organophilum TaxID=410 RepID=A0ABQ4TDP0_METOR|nr:hypothetical protein [Methylobacterium organophilum]GJE29174.1 hypothetical protein LKMONMHP_4053 [Methylobacterium organophilum]